MRRRKIVQMRNEAAVKEVAAVEDPSMTYVKTVQVSVKGVKKPPKRKLPVCPKCLTFSGRGLFFHQVYCKGKVK